MKAPRSKKARLRTLMRRAATTATSKHGIGGRVKSLHKPKTITLAGSRPATPTEGSS